MLWKLFISFFKIGAFTFGGGWAMIALIEKELVDKRKWMERADFYDTLSLVQALPGVIAVNIAVALGYRLRGKLGATAAALGSILPSFMIILAIAIFLQPSVIKDNPVLAAIFKGIRPAVVALIAAPVFSSAKAAGITWRSAIIPIGAALLVWSKLPIVSSPILLISVAILVGCSIALWKQRKARDASKTAQS